MDSLCVIVSKQHDKRLQKAIIFTRNIWSVRKVEVGYEEVLFPSSCYRMSQEGKKKKKKRKMLVPIMWIQNAAHSVLWICINIVFFHVPVISNVRGVVAFGRVMYLDAHVRPPPLFDVNATTLSVEPEINIIYLPVIYINHSNVTSFSVCRGRWSTSRERGEKRMYKYIYIYKVIWHCAVHKSDISNFFFPLRSCLALTSLRTQEQT